MGDLIGRTMALASGDLQAVVTWPPPWATPAAALAQHYGLPICLLDFTWDPFIAAYFAARGWMELGQEPDEPLCVWIIDDPNLAMKGFDPKHSLELIIPPASDNQTLQAQDGLFLWHRLPADGSVDVTGEYQEHSSFESILSESHAPWGLIKLLLHTRYPWLLMHKIIKLGYDGARLFPGFAGPAQAVKEYAWSRIPSM